MPYYRHPCSAACFQAPSGGEKRLSPGSPGWPGTRGRVRGPFSRGDGANLESRGARVTQIRGLDVATLRPFGRSENSAWGWRKSGVPGNKSHADSWPRCRHVAAVWPLSILACNSHADPGPRSRHAAAVWPLSILACNSHADPGPRSRHAAAVWPLSILACNSHADAGLQSRHARTLWPF